MKLTVTNLLDTPFGVGMPVGLIPSRQTVVIEVTGRDLEKMSSELASLKAKGIIGYAVDSDINNDEREDDTQLVTRADLSQMVSQALTDTNKAATRIQQDTCISASNFASVEGGPEKLLAAHMVTLAFNVNDEACRAYQVFQVPSTYVDAAEFHVHWTKSDNMNEAGRTVRWRVGYSVITEQGATVGEPSLAVLDGTYTSASATHRVVHKTPPVEALGFLPGALVAVYVEAITPLTMGLASRPALVSLDVTYRVRVSD